jgi:hypothetical protein
LGDLWAFPIDRPPLEAAIGLGAGLVTTSADDGPGSDPVV